MSTRRRNLIHYSAPTLVLCLIIFTHTCQCFLIPGQSIQHNIYCKRNPEMSKSSNSDATLISDDCMDEVVANGLKGDDENGTAMFESFYRDMESASSNSVNTDALSITRYKDSNTEAPFSSSPFNPLATTLSMYTHKSPEIKVASICTNANQRILLLSSTFVILIAIGVSTQIDVLPAWALDVNDDVVVSISSLNNNGLLISATGSQTQDILSKSLQKALGGGKAGALAAIVQVLSLMWLRTAMNYQYRFGGTLPNTLKLLYSQGGVGRLYQGLPFALLQGPLTRFGDTFCNVGSLALLQQVVIALNSDPSQTQNFNTLTLVGLLSSLPVKTALGSISAALFRILLMPIDTCKTVMQVDGGEGLKRLVDKVKDNKSLSPLYQGSLASAAATAAGHFPWFLTYNILTELLPSEQSILSNLLTLSSSSTLFNSLAWDESQLLALVSLIRSALTGLAASCVSDTVSNSLRVIKTTKQTASLDASDSEKPIVSAGVDISYQDAVRMIIAKDGWLGLFGRGLQTRLLTNAIQGAAFSVLWKFFQQH